MPFGEHAVAKRRKTIAVIDRDRSVRAEMWRLLSAFGFCAEIYDSATAFLDAVATSEATCIVVDIQLGDISGVELARQLAADGIWHPIIFVTALDDELIRAQAMAAGAVAYLKKPFPGQLLIEAIIKSMG
jgi:FixJ family two-component response regulator